MTPCAKTTWPKKRENNALWTIISYSSKFVIVLLKSISKSAPCLHFILVLCSKVKAPAHRNEMGEVFSIFISVGECGGDS